MCTASLVFCWLVYGVWVVFITQATLIFPTTRTKTKKEKERKKHKKNEKIHMNMKIDEEKR